MDTSFIQSSRWITQRHIQYWGIRMVSERYRKYLVLMAGMQERAYTNKITKRDLRIIAEGNAGDKLRAARMTLAFLESN